MLNKPLTITVFEHQTLRLGHEDFKEVHLKALQKYYGEKGVDYFSLIHRGVKFNQFVGVIQVGKLIIEVLPKADRETNAETEPTWRERLVEMLRAVGAFPIHAPSSSSLTLKHNYILDLYFELFVKEVEYLVHKGLVKKYRKREGNSTALKGNLLFAQHIQQNLVHQERFFVRHTTYDKAHVLHQILLETLHLLQRINQQFDLQSRIGRLLLSFPELPNLKVNEATFQKLKWHRKTEDYRAAVEIARLLLLNYHPDLSAGKQHVLALMFNMNRLWEEFVYVSLKKHFKANDLSAEVQVSKRNSMPFWKPKDGNKRIIKPDIVLSQTNSEGEEETIVLDTKWKNNKKGKPTMDDLRQMYVYHEFYETEKVALIYPGCSPTLSGNYFTISRAQTCSLLFIPVKTKLHDWQQSIAWQIKDFCAE